MRLRFFAIAVASAVVVVSTAGPPAAAGAPAFAQKPCPGPQPDSRMSCGTVTVAENRSAPGQRTIALNVVVVRAAKPRSDSVPLFHLDGGPGVAATAVAQFYLGPGEVYAATRDVVLVDQRGTGASAPLHCSQLEQRAPWAEEYPPADVAACRRELESRADLRQFSTDAAAADLDDVRAALGYRQIDLWALSYGTRLAQVYLKRFPAQVHAAVLVGFAPLDYRAPLYHAINAQRVLDLLFYDCARDDACGGKYPALRTEWQAVLARVGSGPVTAPRQGTEVSIARGPFGEIVRNMLTTAAGQRALPQLVHAAAGGDFSGFVAGRAGAAAPLAEGLYLSIVCSEAVPRIPADPARFAAGTFLGSYRVDEERGACTSWPRYQVADDFYAPPRGSAPILVMSGTMDHVTTPDWAREFCAATEGSTLVAIPGMGHGPFDFGQWTGAECFDRVAAEFLANPRSLDASCVAAMRPPAFK
jgi:pimeloyl-ACP methyl ester carboxylesterase